MSDTRSKLIEGTLATLRDKGLTGTSARTIAAAAGVNQALVFYHFGSVAELIDAASREATEERVALYRPRFDELTSLRELLALGQELHETERDAGNVTVLAQVLAGAQQDVAIARAAEHALALWVAEIERVLRRLLKTSPLGEVTDAAGLARGIAAAFIGLELYEGVDKAGADQAMASLELLGVVVEAVDDLGPVARRAVRAALRRTTSRSAKGPRVPRKS